MTTPITQIQITPKIIPIILPPEIIPDSSIFADNSKAACAAAMTGRKSVDVLVAVAVAKPLGDVVTLLVTEELAVALSEKVLELVAESIAEPLGDVVPEPLVDQDCIDDALAETELDCDSVTDGLAL